MSNDRHNRTMMGISPFRAEDDDINDLPAEFEVRTTGDRPVVAPVSLSDDGGWDLPDALPVSAPVAAAAPAAPAAPAAGSTAVDDEAASLRGGTMMLSGAAFQAAMAEMNAVASSEAPASTALAAAPAPAESSLVDGAPAVESVRPATPTADVAKLNSTVRLSALDFERLMTSGSQPAAPSAEEVALSKHALGSDDLTDARVALPSRLNPAPAPALSVAARVADNRAAASDRGNNAQSALRKGQGNSMVYVVAGALITVLVVGAALVWLFVVNR